MRTSHVITQTDSAGPYEVEIFDCPKPKGIVVCSHGKGVRRWDGENFFPHVADHYSDRVFLLVDQNQPYKTGCKLNDLAIMVTRVQDLVDKANKDYPGVPVVVLGHSMGCGVASRLQLETVDKVIFVAPAAGTEKSKLIGRYGEEVINGKEIISSDGLIKYVTKEFYESVQNINWNEQYKSLLSHYPDVYVFESGDEEIVGNERFALRDLPFAGYKIIPGAQHNLTGEPLQLLFAELDELI